MLRLPCSLLVLAVASASVANPEPRRAVTAAIPADWPPHYVVGADGRPTGFAIDTMNAVAARAGLEVRYRVYVDFGAAMEALRRGEADLIPNVGITEERLRDFAFTSPIDTFVVTMFARRGSLASRVAATGGAPRRIAAVRTNVGVELAESIPATEVVVFADVRTALLELLSGQVDALIYPEPVLNRIAAEAGLEDRIEVIGEPLREVKRAIAVRRDDVILLDRLDRAAVDLIRSAEFQDIYLRWFGPPHSFLTPVRLAWLMGGTLLVALLAMALWRYRTIVRLNRKLLLSIDERRRAQEALTESEGHYRLLMEQASDGIFVFDMDGRLLDVNRRGAEMLGRKPEALHGAMLAALSPAGPPLDREALRGGRTIITERELACADGTRLPVEISARMVVEGRVQAIARDISTRRRAAAEMHAEEQRREQAQKMEAVGRLAGGLAHDFNNLLTAVSGYTELLLQEVGRDHPIRPDLEEIRKASTRAEALTQQLLAFSRRQVLRPRPFDLSAVVRDIEKLLRRVIPEHVEIETRTPEPAWALADPGQVEQVIVNLAVNARDAMPRGGTLVIRTRHEAPAAAGPRVVLEVTDSGSGMSPETLLHIFEPFFTTKDQGKGTGLGLATVYGIVRQSGGSIDVESREDRGTTFRVHLPAATEPVPEGQAAAVEVRAATGHESILLVEDEASVRSLVARVLSDRGYRVREAGSGEEALALASAEPDAPIDLLVTDVVMPRIGGLELAERLQAARPDIRVLFISGYPQGAGTSDGLLQGQRAFLAKPFNPEVLARRVRDLLDLDRPSTS